MRGCWVPNFCCQFLYNFSIGGYLRKKEYFRGKYRVNRGRPWPRKLYIGVSDCPSVQFPQNLKFSRVCLLSYVDCGQSGLISTDGQGGHFSQMKPGRNQDTYRAEQGNWQLQVKTKPTNRLFRFFYFPFESNSLVCISLEAVDFVRRVVWVLPYKPNIGISDGSEQGDLQKTNIMAMTWKIWEQKSSCMIIGHSSH